MNTPAFNIFDELTKWAQTLEMWLQCALGKIVAQGQLSEGDYEQIFSEFMTDKGLRPTEGERNKYSLNVPDTTKVDNSQAVKLRAIKDVRGVNALTAGQELTFGGSDDGHLWI